MFVDRIKITRQRKQRSLEHISSRYQKLLIECLGAYVISMTSTASDILSVYFLQMQAQNREFFKGCPTF